MQTSGSIVCTIYSSTHDVFFTLSRKCHEGYCSDVVSNVIRQSTNEIKNGRPSELYLKPNSKLLCQPMDFVYNSLEIINGTFIVSSSECGLRNITKLYSTSRISEVVRFKLYGVELTKLWLKTDSQVSTVSATLAPLPPNSFRFQYIFLYPIPHLYTFSIYIYICTLGLYIAFGSTNI